jgi:hypothetical protein
VLGLILAVVGGVMLTRGPRTAEAGVPAQRNGSPRHAAQNDADEETDRTEATAAAGSDKSSDS